MKIENIEKPLSPHGLKYLADVPSIADIDLEGSRITDRSLVYLSQKKSLRALVVDGTNNTITDVGMFYISKLTSLEEVINSISLYTRLFYTELF